MAYTVKRLSKISKVSVRTLHYYDEIGLLKPSYLTSGGYRHYEEEELLKLQQILFFKELGFELKQIKKILNESDLDRLKALSAQKQVLKDNVSRLQLLIQTIEKTIKHIKGEIQMKDEEMYTGFSKEKQKQYEDYLVNRYGKQAEDYIAESKRRVKNWKKQDFEDNKRQAEEFTNQLVEALEKGLDVSSEEVQKLVKKHYEWIKKFYTPTKDVYIGLGELYKQHSGLKKFYDNYHPKLAEYLAEAMKVFADNEL